MCIRDRDARVYMCTCTVHDKLSCTHLQNYTHIPKVCVGVGVGPMEFKLIRIVVLDIEGGIQRNVS